MQKSSKNIFKEKNLQNRSSKKKIILNKDLQRKKIFNKDLQRKKKSSKEIFKENKIFKKRSSKTGVRQIFTDSILAAKSCKSSIIFLPI